jgi:hypothetical protein
LDLDKGKGRELDMDMEDEADMIDELEMEEEEEDEREFVEDSDGESVGDLEDYSGSEVSFGRFAGISIGLGSSHTSARNQPRSRLLDHIPYKSRIDIRTVTPDISDLISYLFSNEY